MVTTSTFRRKVRSAERQLIAACPRLSAWIEIAGPCTLMPELNRSPAESLVRAVAHQQLHAKAAESILGRLVKHFDQDCFPSSEQLAKLRVPQYRKFGFSESKAHAIRGVAKAACKEIVPSREQADQMSNEELIQTLTELKGIGRWTVEMMLIFTMGRLDVMPVDDFGVKAGLMHLFRLPEMPKKKDFPNYTDHWSPHRSIAAWYLWRLADARKGGV